MFAINRSGEHLPFKKPRLQLITIRKDCSNVDVNGDPLSDVAKTKRIASLALCNQLHSVLTEESSEENISQAINLFEDLGLWSNDINEKKEAFVCVTCSGLLLLCVDVALKAIEEWCNFSSAGIVHSASLLLRLDCLEGAEGVTTNNWKYCHDEEPMKIIQRWRWYIESNHDANGYFQRYVFESIKEDAITKIAEVYEHSPSAGKEVVDGLVKALYDHFQEDASDASEEEMSEYSEESIQS